MEYQIVRVTGRANPYVLIEGSVYPLCAKGGEEGFVGEDGEYGPVVQAYMAACREVGVTPHFNWQGIANANEDFGAVYPPKAIRLDGATYEPWHEDA